MVKNILMKKSIVLWIIIGIIVSYNLAVIPVFASENLENQCDNGDSIDQIENSEMVDVKSYDLDTVNEDLTVSNCFEEQSVIESDSETDEDITTFENDFAIDEKNSKEIPVEPELSIQCNALQNSFTAELRNYVDNSASGVEIAVWSKVDGQDDLVWYSAGNQGNGSWQIEGNIGNHKKSTGIYYFHAYATINGVKKFITAEKIDIAGITIGKQVTIDKDEKKWKFRVDIGEVFSPAEIQSLNVAVWSEKKGQDDLKWYSGMSDKEGQWYINVDCKDHGYDSGNYIVHVYARDARDVYSYIGGARTNFSHDFSTAVIRTIVDSEHTGAEVILKNIQDAFGGDYVAYIWSKEGGQDDLCPYVLSGTEGNWKTSFNIKKHKNCTGIYYIHIYYVNSEESIFITGAAVNIEGISADELKVTSCDLETGKFYVKIPHISAPTEIRQVRVAVWSDVNGQDDLVWYEMKSNKNAEWEVSVPLSKHQYELGAYYLHAYASDGRGVTQCVKTLKYTVNIDAIITAKVNDEQNQISVTLHSKKLPAQIKTIRFAVWSDLDGQDDLKWYTFDKTYTQKIDIKDHKYNTGKYYIHAYAMSLTGQQVYINGTTFQIANINPGTVKVEKTDLKKGIFSVIAQGISSPSEIKSVRFAVWTKENGQDDLIFYSGRKTDKSWKIDVDTYAHNYESGSYYVHVYAKDTRGVEAYIGGTILDFKQDMSDVNLMITNDQTNNRFTIVFNDNKVGKDIVEIQFAVWSGINGQDDLKWYTASKIANNQWSKIVQTVDHKTNSGVYYVHAYGVLANGKRYCLKTGQATIMNNWKPEVQTKNISVGDISRAYNFLFVSDTHVIVTGENDVSDVKALASSRIPYFTNADGMTSEEQLPYWIQYANDYKVDGVLMGGDIVDYPSTSNLKYLKDNLNQLKMPYVYTFGNHDWLYPWDQTTQEYRPLFDTLMNGSGAAHYTEYEELVVLAVDDSTYQVSAEALPVVERALSLEKPVLLLMHVPLQTDSLLKKSLDGWNDAIVIGPNAKKPNKYTQSFLDMILADDSPVRAILAGHVHMEDTSKINDRITQYVVDMSAKGKGIMVHIQ